MLSLCVNQILFLCHSVDRIVTHYVDHVYMCSLVKCKHIKQIMYCIHFFKCPIVSTHLVFLNSMMLKHEVVPLQILFTSMCLLMYVSFR
jgi:hypothetical protein